MKYNYIKHHINSFNDEMPLIIINYLPKIPVYIKHNYCKNGNHYIDALSKNYTLKELSGLFSYCSIRGHCKECPCSSMCEDGFYNTIERAFKKYTKCRGEIKMPGTKSNDIHLLIAMLEDNHLHFNMYVAVMDYVKKLIMAEGDITEDELDIISFGDINLSKETYEKYKPVLDKIANDYFPFYAVTALDDEEATPNIFTLEATKVFTPLKDGNGVDENDYIVNIHLEWDDVDDIPEECKV